MPDSHLFDAVLTIAQWVRGADVGTLRDVVGRNHGTLVEDSQRDNVEHAMTGMPCHGDGVTDDTAAFQNAMMEQRVRLERHFGQYNFWRLPAVYRTPPQALTDERDCPHCEDGLLIWSLSEGCWLPCVLCGAEEDT